MNKFTTDSNAMHLQRLANLAARNEIDALRDYLDGVISESEYMKYADSTETACKKAIAFGVSVKDLPVH